MFSQSRGLSYSWRSSLDGFDSGPDPGYIATAMLRFIEPCLPSPADRPPSGSNWIHEIKHDGYRLMARRDPVGIRLDHPAGQRLVVPLPSRGRGGEPPQGVIVPDRR
jgi:hypothetical protein